MTRKYKDKNCQEGIQVVRFYFGSVVHIAVPLGFRELSLNEL